jgi:DNA-binding SARP family transcriptional activator
VEEQELMLKLKEMTAAEACKRMDMLAREYLHLDRFDPRREQIRKELYELAALVEPNDDQELKDNFGEGGYCLH